VKPGRVELEVLLSLSLSRWRSSWRHVNLCSRVGGVDDSAELGQRWMRMKGGMVLLDSKRMGP